METVRSLYLEGGYNCAEAILRLANEKYALGITPEDLKLLGGFGGGLCCGASCGALCAGVAVLSRLAIARRAHESDSFNPLIAGFAEAFREKLGATDCRDLKPRYVTAESRCLTTVELGWQVLQEYIAEKLGR